MINDQITVGRLPTLLRTKKSSAETGAYGSNEGIPWGMTGAPKGPVPFTVEIGGQKFEGVVMPPPHVRRDYEQVADEVAQKIRNEPSLDHSKIEVTLKHRKTWTRYETYFWYVVAKKH